MIPKVLKILEYDKIIEMLMAECSSSVTKKRVASLKPGKNPHKIESALGDTEEAVEVLMKKGTPPLGNFYDISGSLHLAALGGTLSMKQLLEIEYNLGCARKTAEFLSSDLPELRRIDDMRRSISVLKQLENEIERCILSEDEMADSASPELNRTRRSIERKNAEIRSKIQRMAGSAEYRDYLQDAIVTQRQGRYVIPVKSEHKSRLPGIVHDQSASGATFFIEPQAIVDINNELAELELAEKKEVLRVLKELSGQAGREEVRINANQAILQELDFMFAKGRLACEMRASRPAISESGKLRIRKGRHPLIDSKKVVPTDIEIGGEYRTLVITGPNTGGKTVALKTLGLLCLMAQAGLFVPAAEGTTMPIFKKIYADIGDEQSIEQSLSTFSSHMNNIVGIVKGAGEGSLVLLDELGAGTDPTEGAALAIAILDRLYEKGAYSAATTHYTELKKYAITKPGVQNASMEFDVETLSPTFRLMMGLPGKSNAFLISQRLGLDPSIVENAGALLEGGDIAFEDLISKIQSDRKQAEEERDEAIILRLALEKQKERIDELETRLREKRESILRDARDEAKEIVDDARAEINEIRKEISESKLAVSVETERRLKRSVEDGRRRLAERRKELGKLGAVKAVSNEDAPAPEDIEIGARVNVLSVGQKGEVLTLPDNKDELSVLVGQIRLNVKLGDITLVRENVTEKERQKTKYSRMFLDKGRSTPLSVNVIGKNLDEAAISVDKYIDDAFMAGLGTVSVIHGRGAGILRDGLRKMLRENEHVESIRPGEYKEGGDGVTVVKLRSN